MGNNRSVFWWSLVGAVGHVVFCFLALELIWKTDKRFGMSASGYVPLAAIIGLMLGGATGYVVSLRRDGSHGGCAATGCGGWLTICLFTGLNMAYLEEPWGRGDYISYPEVRVQANVIFGSSLLWASCLVLWGFLLLLGRRHGKRTVA